jgi:hypothetical protein
MPAFAVGWLGLAQQKIDSEPDTQSFGGAAQPQPRAKQ